MFFVDDFIIFANKFIHMRTLLLTILSILTFVNVNASITFSGTTKNVITETPDPTTGLNKIFILHDFNGVRMTYTATTTSPVTWYKYNNLGGGYAEEVSGIIKNGKTYTLNITGKGDMGYIIEEGSNRYYCWVVDYSQHMLQFSSLNIATEQECDMTELSFQGNAGRIIYYTINGQSKEVNRDIKLLYNTLRYNESTETYDQLLTEKAFSYINSTIRTEAPLCNTEFTLIGDKFLKEWGKDISITSDFYNALAVEAKTTATQSIRENDNEQKEETTLGGSAPCEIEFKAICSDAAIYKEWQMATDAEFENITLRLNEPITSYTFEEHGTTYVRFMASNATGSCDYISDTYEIFIGESRLECPNAFSPNASEGVNDEWKVSYKSIISFECHIFNRWGIKVAEFNDPSQGWDGKHNGKFVPSGVYYYVIKAEGSDGKKYNLNGDINIIKYAGTNSLNTTPTE